MCNAPTSTTSAHSMSGHRRRLGAGSRHAAGDLQRRAGCGGPDRDEHVRAAEVDPSTRTRTVLVGRVNQVPATTRTYLDLDRLGAGVPQLLRCHRAGRPRSPAVRVVDRDVIPARAPARSPRGCRDSSRFWPPPPRPLGGRDARRSRCRVASSSLSSSVQRGRPLGHVVEDAARVVLRGAARPSLPRCGGSGRRRRSPGRGAARRRHLPAWPGRRRAAAGPGRLTGRSGAPGVGSGSGAGSALVVGHPAHALKRCRRMAATLEKIRMPRTTTTPVESWPRRRAGRRGRRSGPRRGRWRGTRRRRPGRRRSRRERPQATEDRVQRGDDRDGQVRLQPHRDGRLQQQPARMPRSEAEGGDHARTSPGSPLALA